MTCCGGGTIAHYVDNTSAEAALIRGYSPSAASAPLVHWVADADVRLGARSWFDRVPSPSNPADAPSRLDFAACEAAGWERVEPKVGDWTCPRGA